MSNIHIDQSRELNSALGVGDCRRRRSAVSWQAGRMIVAIALLLGLLDTSAAFATGEKDCAGERTVKVIDEKTKVETKKRVPLRELHNPGLAAITDYEVCFDGYVSNFDGKSENEEGPRRLRVPLFVAHSVAAANAAVESRERPSKWFTIDKLVDSGIAPTDQSYVYSASWRNKHPDWYERGHLAQKYLLERISPDAARYSHNVANAVPQRGRFNKTAWLSLECHVGAWANKYGQVWVLTGPVFEDGEPRAWLKEPRRVALPVAIPDQLFKIVLRKDNNKAWQALSFIMPQQDERYANKSKELVLADWGSSIDRIEQLANLRFLADVPKDAEMRKAKTKKLWSAGWNSFDPACRKFVGEES